MPMTEKVLPITHFNGLKLFKRGKVRDVYDLGAQILIVSTDRISCFDVVLPDCVPEKGRILTQLSCFWFDLTRDIVPNHVVSADVDQFPKELQKYRDELVGRSMIVKKTELIPFECVVRGYISGSGWKEYKENGRVGGIKLPPDLVESEKLPQAIFTPATKADEGHDMNISEKEMAQAIGKELTGKLKELSLAIYHKASAYAEKKGIIIADTKFEFGLLGGSIIFIDEALTPDSSRFWPKNTYAPGKGQPSFDKQFVRDYLETLHWNKTPPAPNLPAHVIEETTRKYQEICDRLVNE